MLNIMGLAELRRRRDAAFAWLNSTQFLGALNDDVFKGLITMYLIGMFPEQKDNMLSLATVLFAAPFLFLTPYGGFMADRFSKNVVTVVLKYAELAIMIAGIVAFFLGSRWGLFVLLFGMSAQSALFSPTKYSIVPELVKRERLPHANSMMVISTFMAIILGSAFAPALAKGTIWLWGVVCEWHDGDAVRWLRGYSGTGAGYAVAQLVCVAIAVAGIMTSYQVWRLRPANPTLKAEPFFLRQVVRTARWVAKDRALLLAVLATGVFSMVAGFLKINLVRYGIDFLGMDAIVASYLFFFAALGIAAGAFLSGRMSRRNIDFTAMPTGSALILAAAVIIGLLPKEAPRALVWMCAFVAGMGSGMFTVPLDAFLQFRLPLAKRGEAMALNSLVSWLGIVGSGLLLWMFSQIGISARRSFLWIAVLPCALVVGSAIVVRQFIIRSVVSFIVRLFYRVRFIGLENLPTEGAALLVANHASYMDALLLTVSTKRRIRFLMSREIYHRWRFLMPIFRLYDVIVVGDSQKPRQILQTLRESRKALDEGYIVCVFAEGAITRTGTLRSFRKGFERIVAGSSYPIIPIYLGGSWGTIYHYYAGQLVRNWFRSSLSRYRVTILFGTPMPPTATAYEVRQAVMELSVDYFNARRDEHRSLGLDFVVKARRNWGFRVMKDTTGKQFTMGRTLTASVILKNALAERVKDQENIGVLMPPCCAGSLCNVAVALLGRVAVNLNFTVSAASFASAIRQCNLRTILTSRQFLERFPNLEFPEGSVVCLEDILATVKPLDKIKGLLQARFANAGALSNVDRLADDAVAMVVFSSGSTGEPKGVMLSHHNIMSMMESLRMVFATSPKDRICAALPFFHSFGIMGTVWYPFGSLIGVSYHANPLDAQAMVDLVRDDKCTLLFSTPTFLTLYLRKAERKDFATLRHILAGAEKLKESIVNAYVEKLGHRPFDAYGATELSPGIAVSTAHGQGGDLVQEGWKQGRVGIPIPGVATRILDPDSGAPVTPGHSGLLWLKGPNVMMGYLGRPDLTDEVIKDGWYCTGDIAFVDEDGFLGLTDRLARFSKLGGEMVPHLAVEEALLAILGTPPGNLLAVTGIPDDRKGESLAVLYTPDCGDINALFDAMEKSNLPNLWKPDRAMYFPVPAIPVLGTGKTDLAGVKSLARAKASP
ncbi:MAG: MFS transporter [Kiritimatiellaeota bacterium]|nr:MFS transporter [Kiritimatiellota bacterium]